MSGLSFDLREIEEAIPRQIAVERIELPPEEMRGRVIPVTGAIPIFIPILRKVWKARKLKIPARTRRDWRVLVESIMESKRNRMIERRVITTAAPANPSSSASEAKIKSVCLSGRNLRCD